MIPFPPAGLRSKWLAVAALLVIGVSGVASLSSADIRVVSQTVGTDEMLLALAEPAQIAALSHLAADPVFSAVAAEAAPYPRLDKTGDAEGVLKFQPTLVLAADFSRGDLVAQVRRAGVRVLVFDHYESLEDAFSNLRLLAAELGPDAQDRAGRIIADAQARVAILEEKLRGAKPVRVIAPSTYGMIPGAKTTFQDLCDHAGAENLAATLGGLAGHQPQPGEQMLLWPVDRVVLAGDDLERALAAFRRLPPYSHLSAVRAGHAVLLEPWQLSCMTHHRVRGYEQLARALHPERFP